MKTLSKTILKNAEIPAMPAILQQVMSLTSDPNVTSSKLEDIVSKEPGLVAHLMKLVNSAYYALPRKISSLSHAISILGFATLKSLASGLILFNLFKNLSGLEKQYITTIWRRSLKSSAIIKILSRGESAEKKDDLFLASMIHDVGHLILSQYFQAKYRECSKNNPFPSVEEEKKLFEIDHTEIGAEILREWKFAESVVQIVRHHHNPELYEGNKKDIHYLTVCDRLADDSINLDLFLAQEESQVDAYFSALLLELNWTWAELQQQKEALIAGTKTIEQSLKS